MTYKGTMFSTHPDTGELVVTEWDLPIDMNFSILAWGEDLIRALNNIPYWRRWLIRRLMGKYAWRELIGLRDDLLKKGYPLDGWSAVPHECEYYKDKVGDL